MRPATQGQTVVRLSNHQRPLPPVPVLLSLQLLLLISKFERVSRASLSGQGTCTLPKRLIALTLLHQTTPPHSNLTPTSTSNRPARSLACLDTQPSSAAAGSSTPQPLSRRLLSPSLTSDRLCKSKHTVNRILVGLPSRYCRYSQLSADSPSLLQPPTSTQLPTTDVTNLPTPPHTTLLTSSPPYSR